jgi:predicted MPP superfamily phosphohydrolase
MANNGVTTDSNGTLCFNSSDSGDIDLSVIESFVSWMTVGENLMHKFTINGSTGVPYYVNASRCCTLDMIWVEDAYIKNIYPALDMGIALYNADKTFDVAYDWFTYSSDYGRTDRAINVQHRYVRFYFCKAGARTSDFSKAEFHQYSKLFMEGKLVEITDSVGANAIGEEIRNGYPYYYNGEMKATVDTLCSKESYGAVKFALISDLHDNDKTHLNETIEKQVMAIRDIAKKNGLHFVICGGDLTDGNETLTKGEVLEKMTAQVRMFKEIGVPVLFLRGNHDDNSYASYEVENVISRQEFYARCMAPFGGKIIQDGKCYYYQDFDEVNTRVICLDYIDYPWIVDDGSIVYGAGGSNIWRGYSDEQIAWLLGTALNCNKRIIVTGHYTTHPNIMTNYEKGKDTNYTIVKQALEAYNARGSVTFGGNTYSFAEKTGKVLIQATAHSHSFGAFKDNGIVWASTGSASAEVTNRTNGYDNIPPYETMLSRTYGDITEAHFNVFSCDDSNVHIVSFGQMGNLDFEV